MKIQHNVFGTSPSMTLEPECQAEELQINSMVRRLVDSSVQIIEHANGGVTVNLKSEQA